MNSIIAEKEAVPNILILNWRGPDHPQAGGAEVYLTQIARRWVSAGAAVTFVCADSRHRPFTRETNQVDDFTILMMGNRFTIFLLVALYLLRHGRKYDTIVDTGNGIPFFAPLFTRTPVVLLVHHVHRLQWNREFHRPLASIGWFLESRIVPLLYRNHPIITVSCTSANELQALGIDRRQIWIVHNGNIPQKVHPNGQPDAQRILYVGRLKHYKRVHLLVHAVDHLREEFPHIHLDIVGRGPECQELRTLIQRLNLQPHVTLHGYLDEDKKAAMYSRATVFATASLIEGWGITVVEANSHAVPVVAFEVPGLSESVRHGETGFLVPPSATMEEFTAAIKQVLGNSATRDRLAAGGLRWAKRFDWDESAEKAWWVLQHGHETLHQRREQERTGSRHPLATALNWLNALPGRFMVFGSFAGTSLINYGFGLLMAALLLPGDFGLLAFAQTILLLAGLILNSGYAWSLTATLPRAQSQQERGRLVRGMLFSNFLLAVVLSVLLIGLFATGLLRAGLEQWSITLLIAATFPFLSVIAIGRGTMRGVEAFGSMGIIQVSEVAFKLLAGLALVGLGYGPQGAVAGFLIGAALAASLSLVLIAYELKISFRGGIDHISPLAVSSMFAAVLGMSLLLNLDILALKLFSGADRALVGHYQAAIILANIPYFMTTALLAVLFPQLAAVGALSRTAPRLGETLRLILLFLIPIELAFAFVPEFFLLLLFPDSYVAGAPILRILACGNIALILAATFSNAFMATDRARVPATVLLLIVTIEAIGLVILVPVGQATAAAGLFSIGGLFALFLLAGAYLQQPLNIEFQGVFQWLARYTLVLVLAMIAGFSVYLWTNQPTMALWVSLPVYGGALMLLGLWSPHIGVQHLRQRLNR